MNKNNDTINTTEFKLLTEAQKNESVLKTIKEALLPLISSADTETVIESIKSEYNMILEKKDSEISSLVENLRLQTEELQSLSEQTEKMTEEFETRINEERESRLLVEDKLIVQETRVYAYDKVRENFRLRNYTPQLLECKSKKEVDRLVETITSLYNNGDIKIESVKGKGLSTDESVAEYLKQNGRKESGFDSDDDLSLEELEEVHLAGIKAN